VAWRAERAVQLYSNASTGVWDCGVQYYLAVALCWRCAVCPIHPSPVAWRAERAVQLYSNASTGVWDCGVQYYLAVALCWRCAVCPIHSYSTIATVRYHPLYSTLY